MQVLTIVVQSTVRYEDLGVATSGVTFFRTLGSSFGAAVFGTVYANVLKDQLPAAIAASPGVNPAAVTTPAALHAYPAAQIAPIVDAYAHAIHVVFLVAVPVPHRRVRPRAVPQAGAAARYCPRNSLRRGRGLRDAGAATRTSSSSWPSPGSSSTRAAPNCPASAPAPAPRSTPPTPGLSARSICAPGSAETPHRGDQPPVPPACRGARTRLRNAVRHGYLHAQDGQVGLTAAGEEEMGKVVTAMRAWLADELADWGPTTRSSPPPWETSQPSSWSTSQTSAGNRSQHSLAAAS